MSREEIIERIREIVSEETELSKDEILEESKLMRDLELSSLEVLTLVGKLEEAYSMHVDVNNLQKVATIGELADCFCRLA